jgi:uncharacterized protein (TIGR02145 family)
MKSVSGWDAPNIGATNSSGFTALPGGGAMGNSYDGLGWAAHFWSSTDQGGVVLLPSLMNNLASAYILEVDRAARASVRFIKN